MNFTNRLALAGITAAAALVCSSAAQAQQECVDSFVVAGSNDTGPCWTDGTGYYNITWDGGCLATNINYQPDGVDTDIDITANGFTEGIIFFGFAPGECQTITITFEDGSTAGGVEVCNDCVAAVCGDGTCSAGETNADCPEDCEAGECPAGQVADCDGSGECWTEAWVGDAYCDGTAQDFGADLCCYDNDGGDCTEEQCAPLAGACCTGNACSQELPDVCAANGGTFIGGSCEAFPCGSEYEDCGDPAAGSCYEDNGTKGCDNVACCSLVCEVDDACCTNSWDASCADYAAQFCSPNQGDCAAGEVEDCDGSGECWTEAWVGDAYCDGTAQDFGADLCCYDNDGGDCTEEQCEVQVCGDGFCGPGETPVNCPDDCDASECATITATAGDEDGNGCTADGTSGLITLTWEGGCVASTIEFVGLGTLTGVYNSGITVVGIGTASECYDIIVTFDDGTVADPVNGCHSCGEPPVCGDGVCAVGETFETCPADCEDGGCPDGQVADCDLSGECWTEAWIGDGFCDGTAQAYGADLCCYETDGGDCTAEECEGGGDPTGACCVDATCSIATEVDCAGEWQGANTTCDTDTCEVPCTGDFNGDGNIGGGDLTILLAAWDSDNPIPDLNGDGIIGGGDLTILLAAWGIPCP